MLIRDTEEYKKRISLALYFSLFALYYYLSVSISISLFHLIFLFVEKFFIIFKLTDLELGLCNTLSRTFTIKQMSGKNVEIIIIITKHVYRYYYYYYYICLL